MSYVDYLNAVEDLWLNFKMFNKGYMADMDQMIASKDSDPVLEGRDAKKQRDEIVDAWGHLNSAISRHLRDVKGRNLRASKIADRVAGKKMASQIATTIAEQMGGMRRLKAFLGAQLMAIPRGLGIKWPNRQRSRGNYLEVTLRGDDTYDMEFFNLSGMDKKTVKKYSGVYFDQLVDIFEKQTGWYLRI